ncbi:MAG: hypothetical protein AAI946_00235 [Candidatus Hodgkinia cicadicola]
MFDIGFECARFKTRAPFSVVGITSLNTFVKFNWFVLSLDHRQYIGPTQAVSCYSLVSCVMGTRDKRVFNLNGVICCFSRAISVAPFCALEVYDYFKLTCKMFVRVGRSNWVFDVGIGFLKSAQANFSALSVAASLRANAAVCVSRKRFLSLSVNGDQDDLRLC